MMWKCLCCILVMFIVSACAGEGSFSWAADSAPNEQKAAKAAKKEWLQFRGKISSMNSTPPVNGKIATINITVKDQAGQKNIFAITSATRIVDKSEKKPFSATIGPGRNVLVKYEVKDGVNNARVFKLLE